MVTVIANPEEFSSPVQNGVNNVSNDSEGNFHYIKDYQEVDFHRSPSCKPLPEDLLTIINDPQAKSSINGVFFVQIDAIESMEQSNQNGSIDGNKSLMMRITDGCVSVHALTMDEIPHLNFNVKPGCKLLITGVIPIENGLLQLTHDNTHFQFGSRTYPRPRSAYRGRGGGSNRPSYEGRRGGGNNGYNRQEQHSTETNFFKRPPAKNTLMDFMTTLKISRDSKLNHDEEKSKMKENFSETKRRAHEWTKSNNNGNLIQSDSNNNYSTDQPVETTDSSEGVTSESTEIHEQLDSEDDPSQAIYRERRNPLPPRLQRAQEERSRRNTIRHQDEINLVSSEEINGDYRNGTTHHPLMSSSSSSSAYARRSDPRSYISNNLSLNQPHPTPSLHPYGTHPALLPTMSNSGTPYLSYFPPNSAHLGYTMAGGPFANAQANMLPNYLHDNFTLSYGNPYGPVTYLQPPMTNGYNDEMKSFSEATNPSVTSTGSSNDENEITVINESQIDETNESENQSQSSFAETKPIATTSSSPLSSSNDENSSARKTNNEPFDRKVRDSTSNPRPRWKINDVCFARWKEDNQFYLASIVQIRPPFCTVVFLDYQTYDDVHFADLKPIPRDQPNPSVLNPVTVATSELNPLAANASFSMRSDYYPMGLDGYVVLPEVPPFPYNASGTIYMYPTAIPVLSRSNRSTSFAQPMSQRRYDYDNSNHYQENSEMTIDSNSSMSKDSNETSINDSTATSIDDIQRHEPVRGTEKISSDATATPGTDSSSASASSSSDKHDETSGNVAENL